jgi:tetratricopeptide (TPR) repeat protein
MILSDEIAAAKIFFNSDVQSKYLELDLGLFSPEALYSHTKSSLIIFIQENISGPPLGLQRYKDERLGLEGEEVVSYLLGGEYLYAASQVFFNYFHVIQDQPEAQLWRGRYAFIHQQVLTHPVNCLKDLCMESYALVNHNALTFVEYSRVLLYYLQYDLCEKNMILAEQETGIKYNLSGKLGVRTKFQKSATPQLVLSVHSTKEDSEVQTPVSVQMDPDCPLHESPQLEDTSRDIISLEDQIILLSWVNYFFKTRPTEEIQAEVIASYLEKILNKSLDWLVYSQALLYRSKNQFYSYKYKERSALQINTLVEQFYDKEPLDRLQYVFSVGYPLRHWLKVELAEMYMKIGAVMSAFQEFEVVEMWEEAVECLILGNYSTRASELAKEKLQEKRTPRMLCALGDITNDVGFYLEAWDLSRHKCTRAQRTLGKREFDKGNYPQAVEHYKKALEINPLYPNIWFTLGCAYMKLKNWPDACSTFQKLICVDPNLAEGWNNLAACHISLGNYAEAYEALSHGIKHDRSNWKMLENLLILSIKLSKFSTSIECIRNLLIMSQTKLFDSDVFQALNHMSQGKEKVLESVYINLVNTLNVSYPIWNAYADFVQANLGLDLSFDWARVLDLRIKACRNLANAEITPSNARILENLARDLAAAYSKIEDNKIKFEGKLYLNSLCKKIKQATGEEIKIDIV